MTRYLDGLKLSSDFDELFVYVETEWNGIALWSIFYEVDWSDGRRVDMDDWLSARASRTV